MIGRMKLIVPEEIDYVVKIARACALGKRPHLLREDFFVAVTTRMYAVFRAVGVRVRNRPADRRQYQHFIERQVEFDPRQIA